MTRLIFSTLIATAVITACTAVTGTPKEVQREWMLTQFQDFSRQELTALKARVNFSAEQDGNFTAHMGCNNIFFSGTFSASGTVKFAAPGSTMMYCDQGMKLEEEFLKTLPKVTRYKIQGHNLTLTDTAGREMKFVASDWD